MKSIHVDKHRVFHDKKTLDDRQKTNLLMLVSLLLMASAFLYNTPQEIFEGMVKILYSSSQLITDYMELANVGAALFNAGMMAFLSAVLLRVNKTRISGPIIAAFFTVMGFSFFGKNLYNTIPITIGVYLYSRAEKVPFNSVMIIGLFATGVSPIVSVLTFANSSSLLAGAIVGYITGIVVGFIMVPLSRAFLNFHHGFNLYNAGFTAGIIASLAVGIYRMFDVEVETVSIISSGHDVSLSILLLSFFLATFIFGFYLNNWSFKGYFQLMKNSGRLIADFVQMDGLGITLMNMSIMATMGLIYVFLQGGELSGPVLSGILTIYGFSAFGKHPRNVIPIFIGVYLAQLLNVYDPASISGIIAALFGATLAPIAGFYGPFWGIVAGFLHVSMVHNIGYLHGGVNLYNNGFSGGFVAAILVPLIDAYNNAKERWLENVRKS